MHINESNSTIRFRNGPRSKGGKNIKVLQQSSLEKKSGGAFSVFALDGGDPRSKDQESDVPDQFHEWLRVSIGRIRVHALHLEAKNENKIWSNTFADYRFKISRKEERTVLILSISVLFSFSGRVPYKSNPSSWTVSPPGFSLKQHCWWRATAGGIAGEVAGGFWLKKTDLKQPIIAYRGASLSTQGETLEAAGINYSRI
ncbi:hypothetical protein U1Q18_043994 [Sarracenia purpurea var. burkii]